MGYPTGSRKNGPSRRELLTPRIALAGNAPVPVSAARRPPYAAARAVGQYVPGLTRKAFEKHGFATASLLTDWGRIVGEAIAASTVPERLKWPRGVETYGEVEDGAAGRPGATLVVRVDPARALDIEYRGRQILERINAYFGYRAVAELRILQAPLPDRASRASAQAAASSPEPASVVAATVADPGLRAALARMEAGVRGRRS